jgi:chemotaxis protein histidine kinase CheA
MPADQAESDCIEDIRRPLASAAAEPILENEDGGQYSKRVQHLKQRLDVIDRFTSGEASFSDIRAFINSYMRNWTCGLDSNCHEKVAETQRKGPCRRAFIRGVAKALARMKAEETRRDREEQARREEKKRTELLKERSAERQAVLESRFAPILESCLTVGPVAKAECAEIAGLAPEEREQCESRCDNVVREQAEEKARVARELEEEKARAARELEEEKARAAAEAAAAAAARDKKAQEQAACIKRCEGMGKDAATCGRICK